MVLEAMKMEIPVTVDMACEVVALEVGEGAGVKAGQCVAVVKPLERS